MERELIVSGIQEIPLSRMDAIPSDDEIWEQFDGEARFIATRHTTGVPQNPEILLLSVSGPPIERQRIIGEFTEALGAPTICSQDFISPENVDAAAWTIQAVTS